MARIRSIKPDAFASESLARLDFFTRWTFAGLWTYFDDEGYGRGDPRLIRAALFPLDDDVTAKKVDKALDALVGEACICRYEVDGRQYVHAPKWGDHQKVNRPTKTKFPRCPEHDSGTSGIVVRLHDGLTESSVSPHGGLTGGKEQGTGNREPSSPSGDGAFTEFWRTYPRKVSKADAERAYEKATRKADPDVILAGLKAHLPEWEKGELKFIPHAATWLNGERWADEVETPDTEDPYANLPSPADLKAGWQ